MDFNLQGVVVEVKTTLGTYRLDVGELASGPPGPTSQLLRPVITVTANGQTIVRKVSGAGEPETAWWNGLITPALIVFGTGLVALAVRGLLK